MSKIFDSRDTEYKSPFGAAVCGATVRFAVRPGDENVTGVTLLLRREFAGTEQEVALSPGDDGRWQGVYTAPEEPELVWYAFRFSYPEGQRLYGLHGFDDQARWQLTVYDDSRPTPAWFGRGITYQIFPDRFCRTRVPDPAGWWGPGGPPGLGRHPGVAARHPGDHPQQRFLRRQSGGDHLPIRLPTEYGSRYVVPVSDF